METKLECLPPLKRFRVLHQQKESSLPAKKRKHSRTAPILSQIIPPTRLSLPAKKRIWAFPPDFIPTNTTSNSTSSIDLNVEYAASPSPSSCRDGEMETSNNTCESNLTSLLTSVSTETNSNSLMRDSLKSGFCHKEEKQTQDEFAFSSLTFSSKTIISDSPSKDSLESRFCPREEETELEESNLSEITQEEKEEEEEEEDGILCAVCESTDGDPKDPIVFCDGCDLMVHASCYGNPLVKGIPEGDWFCAKCSVTKSCSVISSIQCCLCPVSEGAMKPTTTSGKWAHIICALLVPEVFFEDPEGREGINCEEVPKKRWREGCYVCNSSGRNGCVVECSEPKCELAFHVTCGLKQELCIELKERKSSGGIVVAFCKEHTQLWKKQQETGKFKIVARAEHKH